MAGKHCNLCGSELDGLEAENGVIWECPTHGVRDWVFESQTHTDFAGSANAPRVRLDVEGAPIRKDR